MEKVCTNKNHSYKHNEQINKQNIDNFECFGVKFVKIDFFHFLAPINWKTNEGCAIDLNSKINIIFLSSCMNKSKDL
jgi:hypothetical protein